jgi:5-methylcytosine-specific restriction endonuclease McrA
MAQEKIKQLKVNSQVLVLNASYEPLNIVSWRRAIILLVKDKATVISDKVIRLLTYIKLPLSKMRAIKPSRALIYKRDNHRCQYCGSTRSLTIDHIVPKSKGGADSWQNMVVACGPCNTKKGDRYLEQTGMKLEKDPKAPFSKLVFVLGESSYPEWREYNYI